MTAIGRNTATLGIEIEHPITPGKGMWFSYRISQCLGHLLSGTRGFRCPGRFVLHSVTCVYEMSFTRHRNGSILIPCHSLPHLEKCDRSSPAAIPLQSFLEQKVAVLMAVAHSNLPPFAMNLSAQQLSLASPHHKGFLLRLYVQKPSYVDYSRN